MAAMIETETTVSGIQADKCYYIGTNREKHINKLAKDDRAKLAHINGEWHTYRVSSEDFDPLTGFKRRVSDEQRERMRELAKERFSNES